MLKVAKFFQEEFEKRGLPDEIIDYFQVDQNGNFTYPLDASKSRDKIEQIVYSIANRRLVQQKNQWRCFDSSSSHRF
jgi:hypothetical protein